MWPAAVTRTVAAGAALVATPSPGSVGSMIAGPTGDGTEATKSGSVGDVAAATAPRVIPGAAGCAESAEVTVAKGESAVVGATGLSCSDGSAAAFVRPESEALGGSTGADPDGADTVGG